MARRAERAGNLAKLRAAKVGVRNIEARRIGEIEELTAHLQLHALANAELFAERKIGIVDAVAAEIREIARSVARNLVARKRETACIENGIAGGGSLMVAEAGRKLRANEVRALVAVGEKRRISVHDDRNGRTSLERENRGRGPAADNGVQDTVHVAANPAIAANGNIDDGGEDHAVRCIVGADGTLGFQIVVNLRDAGAEACGDKRVGAGGGIVDGFGESVIALKADVVALALLKADLHGMINCAGAEQREAAESADELRKWAQKIDERNLGIVVNRRRVVEDMVGISDIKKRLKRIVRRVVQRVCGSEGSIPAD